MRAGVHIGPWMSSFFGWLASSTLFTFWMKENSQAQKREDGSYWLREDSP